MHAAARIEGLCEFWCIPIDKPRELLERAYLSTLTAGEARKRERGSTRGVWSWLGRRAPRHDTEPDFDGAYQEAELARLAQLSQFAYGKARKEAAKLLGVPVAFLDKEIEARRAPGDAANGQGRPLELPEPEPWVTPSTAPS